MQKSQYVHVPGCYIDESTWKSIEALRQQMWQAYNGFSERYFSEHAQNRHTTVNKAADYHAVIKLGRQIIDLIQNRLDKCGARFLDMKANSYARSYFIEVNSVLAELFAMAKENDLAIEHFNRQLLFSESLFDNGGTPSDAQVQWSIATNYLEKIERQGGALSPAEVTQCYQKALEHLFRALVGYRALVVTYKKSLVSADITDMAPALFLLYTKELLDSAKELHRLIKQYANFLFPDESPSKRQKRTNTSKESKEEWYNFLAFALDENQIKAIIDDPKSLLLNDFSALYFLAKVENNDLCDSLIERLDHSVDLILLNRQLRAHYQANTETRVQKRIKSENFSESSNRELIKKHSNDLRNAGDDFDLFLRLFSCRHNEGQFVDEDVQPVIKLEQRREVNMWRRLVTEQFTQQQLKNCFINPRQMATGELNDRCNIANAAEEQLLSVTPHRRRKQLQASVGSSNSDEFVSSVQQMSESVSRVFAVDRVQEQRQTKRNVRGLSFLDIISAHADDELNRSKKEQFQFGERYSQNVDSSKEELSWLDVSVTSQSQTILVKMPQDEVDDPKEDSPQSWVTDSRTKPLVNDGKRNRLKPGTKSDTPDFSSGATLFGMRNPFLPSESEHQSADLDEEAIRRMFGGEN